MRWTDSTRPGRLLAPVIGLSLIATLAIAYLAFQPGLTGSFQFDDFSNLGDLAKLQDNPTLDEVQQYLLHGISSPTGRPISLLSFVLQAHDWPLNPAGFVRVNVLLHLLNGTLLFWCLLRLTRLLRWPLATGAGVALLSTLLWLTAPIQLTGVLYVVQRMTELSATFMFSGLLMYLAGRERLGAGSIVSGYVAMSAGLFWGTVVGTLAKENAALMPLLVLVLEGTLLASLPKPPGWRPWFAAFVGLPVAAVILYLAIRTVGDDTGYALREFTLGERLLTESRVLFMYLHKMLLPWPSAVRLMYDDLPISTSLLQPWTTLPALLGTAALLAGAARLRKTAPWFSFAVLWYYGAHLLESTVLPLEIAFEHRNYIASAGVFFGLAAGAAALWPHLPTRRIRIAVGAFAIAYAGLLSIVTYQIADLWGQPFEMSLWAVERQPDSRRAKISLLGDLFSRGHVEGGLHLAGEAAAQWPNDASFDLFRAQAACNYSGVEPRSVEEIASRIQRTQAHALTVIHMIDGVVLLQERGWCDRISPAFTRTLVEAAFGNARLEAQRPNLLLLYSRTLKLEGRVDEARARFREAVDLKPVMILLIQGVLDEIGAGQLDAAREYLRRAESDPQISVFDRWSHRNDVESLRQLMAMVEAKQPDPLESIPLESGTPVPPSPP